MLLFRSLTLILLASLMAFSLPAARAAQEPADEVFLQYETQVKKTITDQLAGLKMADIRAKAGLVMEQPLAKLQEAVLSGSLTYSELAAFYLDRILQYDQADKGLNAVVAINPRALEEARQRDLQKGPHQGPLFGIPLLIKDNINTKAMATSGGTVALADFVPGQDAQVVEKLQEQGAIILGKANLSELANFLDESMPSGYSGKAGQTHNPFDPLLLSPLGSSSGSGAAVAANFAAAALGSETTGSIISPAFIQSLVGFKPSLGRISTQGVLPLSSSMDTVGPMAKSVMDAVAVYNAVVLDPALQLVLDQHKKDLSGLRIGLAAEDPGQAAPLRQALEGLGATVIPVELPHDEGDNEFIMMQDFAADFAAYARQHQAPIASLDELIAFNQKDPGRRIKYGQGLVQAAAGVKNPDHAKAAALVKKAQAGLSRLLEEHRLDAVAFLNSDAVGLPCAAGAPIITVPFGQNDYGEPQGASFFTQGGGDAQLAQLAYAFEQGAGQRLIPERYKENHAR